MRHVIPNIIAMGAVRQSRRDVFKPSRCVQRYRAYRDELRLKWPARFELPSGGWWIIFFMPMPASWSAKKKIAMECRACTVKPDKDNLEKGLLDAIYVNDSRFYDGRVSKYYSDEPRIEIITDDAFNGQVVGI